MNSLNHFSFVRSAAATHFRLHLNALLFKTHYKINYVFLEYVCKSPFMKPTIKMNGIQNKSQNKY